MNAAGQYSLMGISDGVNGVRETLALMRRLVRTYRTSPVIRQLATDIVGGTQQKNGGAEIAAIQNWVRNNIRYTMDVNGVETIQTPEALLTSMHGDCDDQSMLVAALAESIGYSTRFAAVAFSPDNFEHVFAEVLLGTRWVPVETTENVSLGWYPPDTVSRMTVHI